MSQHNLVIVGGPVVNRVARDVNPTLPARLERLERGVYCVKVGGKVFPSKLAGLLLLWENPYNKAFYLLYVAGITRKGTIAATNFLLDKRYRARGNCIVVRLVLGKPILDLDVDLGLKQPSITLKPVSEVDEYVIDALTGKYALYVTGWAGRKGRVLKRFYLCLPLNVTPGSYKIPAVNWVARVYNALFVFKGTEEKLLVALGNLTNSTVVSKVVDKKANTTYLVRYDEATGSYCFALEHVYFRLNNTVTVPWTDGKYALKVVKVLGYDKVTLVVEKEGEIVDCKTITGNGVVTVDLGLDKNPTNIEIIVEKAWKEVGAGYLSFKTPSFTGPLLNLTSKEEVGDDLNLTACLPGTKTYLINRTVEGLWLVHTRPVWLGLNRSVEYALEHYLIVLRGEEVKKLVRGALGLEVLREVVWKN